MLTFYPELTGVFEVTLRREPTIKTAPPVKVFEDRMCLLTHVSGVTCEGSQALTEADANFKYLTISVVCSSWDWNSFPGQSTR